MTLQLRIDKLVKSNKTSPWPEGKFIFSWDSLNGIRSNIQTTTNSAHTIQILLFSSHPCCCLHKILWFLLVLRLTGLSWWSQWVSVVPGVGEWSSSCRHWALQQYSSSPLQQLATSGGWIRMCSVVRGGTIKATMMMTLLSNKSQLQVTTETILETSLLATNWGSTIVILPSHQTNNRIKVKREETFLILMIDLLCVARWEPRPSHNSRSSET